MHFSPPSPLVKTKWLLLIQWLFIEGQEILDFESTMLRMSFSMAPRGPGLTVPPWINRGWFLHSCLFQVDLLFWPLLPLIFHTLYTFLNLPMAAIVYITFLAMLLLQYQPLCLQSGLAPPAPSQSQLACLHKGLYPVFPPHHLLKLCVSELS